MAQNKSLSTQEVADILHVSKSTVYDLIRREEIVSYKIGRKVRFTQDDVDAYIARARHEKSVKPVAAIEAESTFLSPENGENTGIIISGQDVVLDIIATGLNQRGVTAARSYLSGFEGLLSLYQEKVNAAACHLYAGEGKDYNISYVKNLMPGIPATVLNISYRMQGFYVKKGNPKKIKGWADLRRNDISIINRRPGSASRILLDKKLQSMNIPAVIVKGYSNIMNSHLTMANAIASGEADAGLGTERVSKQLEGLEFIPLMRERYDLVVRNDQIQTEEIQALISLLRSDYLLKELRGFSGNDYSDIGKIVAEV